METSAYQGFKLAILAVVDLSKDAIHMHVGLAVFVLWVVLRRGRIDILTLLPVLVVAFAMEALDLRDDYHSFGYMRWSASAHDFINTVFWPVIAVVLVKCREMRKNL